MKLDIMVSGSFLFLGWRLESPTPVTGFTYHGLSGETYPDRMAGGVSGTYPVTGMPVTPYLVPQECGMHMGTKWVTLKKTVSRNPALSIQDGAYLTIETLRPDETLNFSCLPYTSRELEEATHQEELPPIVKTVLVIAGCVRGVGGIDSWGADVKSDCQIDSGKDHHFEFKLVPGGRAE